MTKRVRINMLDFVREYFEERSSQSTEGEILMSDIEDLLTKKIILLRNNQIIDGDKIKQILKNWNLEATYSRKELASNGVRFFKEGILLCSIYMTDGGIITMCIQDPNKCINLNKNIENYYLIGRKKNCLRYIYIDENNLVNLREILSTTANLEVSRTELLIFWFNEKLCLVNLTPNPHKIEQFETRDATATIKNY